MEVLCACDGQFLPHTAAMLCSLLENNEVSRIHLFYSSVDDQQFAKLESFVAGYGSIIARYEMDPAKFQELRVDEHVSIATYYRILAPRILPIDIDKILYLDSDLIVRRSLSDLWNTDLRNYALAAVRDQYVLDSDIERLATLGLPAEVSYFNGGVLLINLMFWRQYNVSERAIAFVRNHPEKAKYWDQDALNAMLVHRWTELPAVWNLQCWNCQDEGRGKDPAIVHFCGTIKPWHWSSLEYSFQSEYTKYRLKTPWPHYKLEGRPGLLQTSYRFLRRFVSPRSFARAVLPGVLKRWLRLHLMSSQY